VGLEELCGAVEGIVMVGGVGKEDRLENEKAMILDFVRPVLEARKLQEAAITSRRSVAEVRVLGEGGRKEQEKEEEEVGGMETGNRTEAEEAEYAQSSSSRVGLREISPERLKMDPEEEEEEHEQSQATTTTPLPLVLSSPSPSLPCSSTSQTCPLKPLPSPSLLRHLLRRRSSRRQPRRKSLLLHLPQPITPSPSSSSSFPSSSATSPSLAASGASPRPRLFCEHRNGLCPI